MAIETYSINESVTSTENIGYTTEVMNVLNIDELVIPTENIGYTTDKVNVLNINESVFPTENIDYTTEVINVLNINESVFVDEAPIGSNIHIVTTYSPSEEVTVSENIEYHFGLHTYNIDEEVTVSESDGIDMGRQKELTPAESVNIFELLDYESDYSIEKNEQIIVSENVDYWIVRNYLSYNPIIDSWTKFQLVNEKIKQGIVLSAGDSDENVNLLLQKIDDDDGNVINYYPTSITIDDDIPAIIITKDFYVEKGIVRRVSLSHDGDADVTTKVTDTISGVDNIKEHIIRSIESDKWRGIANAKSRGKQFCVVVYDADVIKFLGIDYKVRILE